MTHGTKNLLAATAHPSAAPDIWMMLSFFTAFVLLASFSLHRRSAGLIALRTACFGALGLCGFEQGSWPLGLVLSALCIRQVLDMRRNVPLIAGTMKRIDPDRISRLFGDSDDIDSEHSNAAHKNRRHDDPLN
jgi:hypothetical protein